MLALLVLAACDGGGPSELDGATRDAPEGARCADLEGRELCEGGRCRREACRGDEVCADAACVPWTGVELFADFTLDAGASERSVAVVVLPGGFPRAQAESIRFAFGDGVSGFGEVVRHTYAAEGAYPVELEVRMRDGRVLRASKLARIGAPAPSIFLTVDDIPAYLNGSAPLTRTGASREDPSDDTLEAFTILVPTSGFSVDVTLLDDPEDPIDAPALSLTADVPVGSTPPGAELAPRLTWNEGGVRRARWIVSDGDATPEGRFTLTASARTASGRSLESSLTLEARALTPATDPFDRPMLWLFRNDTDFFGAALDASGGLAITEGANGAPDLIEELALVGMQGEDAALNARYLSVIEQALRADVYRYYGITPDGSPNDGIPLTILWSGEEGAPDPAAFAADGVFSMMRFGGSFDGYLGFSGLSPYNEERIDDSTAERGVASGTLISTLLTTPIAEAFAPLRAEPLGSSDADARVLAPGYDPYAETDAVVLARHELLQRLARYVALAIGSVTAHEMGHAMGLMPDGVPPLGFFGGVLDVSFVDPGHTDAHHADLPGLNLMQAGGGFTEVVGQALASIELPRGADILTLAEILALENRLSPYSRAYLQRRLTYSSFDGVAAGYRVGCR